MKRFFAIGLSIAPLFLGILWTRFDKRKQAWHDKLANTVVILKSSLKTIKTAICFYLGIILWTRFDKRKQAWHDKLANTVCYIKE